MIMKKLMLVLMVFISVNSYGGKMPTNQIAIEDYNLDCSPIVSNYYDGIEDGWYSATVSVGYNKYTLDVYVKYNTVTIIDFGNGGSVHSGPNNSGYSYYGGQLSFSTDYNGNITEASTTVTVTKGYNTKYYNVVID